MFFIQLYFVQVWELLCRFYEILVLAFLNFDELEVEFIWLWFESLFEYGSWERDFLGGEVIFVDGFSDMSE